MPYIRRDALGRIDSLHRQPDSGTTEFLSDDHPQVRAFVGAVPASGSEGFDRLDAGFVRVIEDLIDVLIVKNLIAITDLPAQAQNKLYARKSFREAAGKNSLRLFADDGPYGSRELVDDTDFSNLS